MLLTAARSQQGRVFTEIPTVLYLHVSYALFLTLHKVNDLPQPKNKNAGHIFSQVGIIFPATAVDNDQ